MQVPHLKAFKAHIRSFVVEIEVHWQAPGESPRSQSGTGTIIAIEDQGDEKETLCIVATAKHVLPPLIIHNAIEHFPPALRPKLEYRISRSAINKKRTVTLTFGPNRPAPTLHRLLDEDPTYDAVLLAFPSTSDDGMPFVDKEEDMPSLLSPSKLLNEGTPIAWAGYPSIAEDIVDEKQLCYYEGRISATVNRLNPLYLVDGHVSHGVSGGPVWSAVDGLSADSWTQSENKDDLSYGIIGVVSAYRGDSPVPGLCIFTPLNPLVAYLHQNKQTSEISGGQSGVAEQIESKQQHSSVKTATESGNEEQASTTATPSAT